ncbi:hypothetical protein JQ599_08900 [Bradyrhizobium diazoefficiens]|nr:hypothetical protein [Bradyrhizobium diazoefficiens]MBR0700018.1 hypothetical protein [Bradyrhizobium diazoefficiens]MBR0768353.1 hypothetical protein [Bradyrhizobium diazoefficiens]
MTQSIILLAVGAVVVASLFIWSRRSPTPSGADTSANNKKYDEIVRLAIDDAAQLLAYASRTGTSLNSADVQAIILAHSAGNSITPEQEATFWTAASAISKAISPVTLETIKSTNSADGKSAAARAASSYRIRTMVTLVALLVFQIYWLVGATICTDLKEIRGRLETLAEQGSKEGAAARALNDKDPDYAAKKVLADQVFDRWDSLLWQEKISAWADFEVLRNWNVLKLVLIPKSESAPLPESSLATTKDGERRADEIKETDHFLWVFTPGNAEQIQTAQIVLTALLKYVLPILYGALGASAYIVRMIADEVRSYTFSRDSIVRYELRYYLGAVAGFSIAWFTSESKSTETAGILQSLSPLALAFLAGYSVDLLFSFLDRLASAFSSPAPKQSG